MRWKDLFLANLSGTMTKKMRERWPSIVRYYFNFANVADGKASWLNDHGEGIGNQSKVEREIIYHRYNSIDSGGVKFIYVYLTQRST